MSDKNNKSDISELCSLLEYSNTDLKGPLSRLTCTMSNTNNTSDIDALCSVMETLDIDVKGLINQLTRSLEQSSIAGSEDHMLKMDESQRDESSSPADLTSTDWSTDSADPLHDDDHVLNSYVNPDTGNVELPTVSAQVLCWRDLAPEWCASWIDCTLDDLENESLPDDPWELADVSAYMADEISMRWVVEGVKPVFSPRSHELYPCWVEEHDSNKVIWEVIFEEKRLADSG